MPVSVAAISGEEVESIAVKLSVKNATRQRFLILSAHRLLGICIDCDRTPTGRGGETFISEGSERLVAICQEVVEACHLAECQTSTAHNSENSDARESSFV